MKGTMTMKYDKYDLHLLSIAEEDGMIDRREAHITVSTPALEALQRRCTNERIVAADAFHAWVTSEMGDR